MHAWLPEGLKSGLRLGLGLLVLALIDFLLQGPSAAQGGSEGSAVWHCREALMMQKLYRQNADAEQKRVLYLMQAYNYIHQGALWAAVTLIVVSAPEFVGATAWLCVQRLLGNIFGGETPCGSLFSVPLFSIPSNSAAASPADCKQVRLMFAGWLACGLVIGVRSAVGLAFITFAVVVLTSFVRVSNLHVCATTHRTHHFSVSARPD